MTNEPDRATMPRARQTPLRPPQRLLDVLRRWRDRIRGDAARGLGAVAGDDETAAIGASAHADAGAGGDAGGAAQLAARPRTLAWHECRDTRGRTTLTMATAADIREGDVFTIAGIHKPDRRWWPRFSNWVLRRPPPTLPVLQQFKVREVVGSTAELWP